MVAVEHRQGRTKFEDCRLLLCCALSQMTAEDIDDLTRLLRPYYSNVYRARGGETGL
jgi:hypothetical protein